MSTVYVVQDTMYKDSNGELKSRFDLSPAEEFGTLRRMLSQSARPFESEHVIGQLHDELSLFSDDDYLLLIGNPCLIGFAVAIASDVNEGRVNVLQWNGKNKQYIAVQAKLK